MNNRLATRMKSFAAILFATTVAASAAVTPPPIPVPAPPAGGINSAKMPDVVGIHLGMAPQAVLAIMKPMFPDNHPRGLGLSPGYAKFGHAPDAPWLQTLNGQADACGNNECSDVVSVVFNGPPNKQGAIGLERDVNFQQGKRPTPDTLKAALLQKYGPNPFVVNNPAIMGWVYDEQGQPIAPPNGKSLVQCAGTITSGAGDGPSPTNAALEYGITGTHPMAQADVNDLMRNPCQVGVYVLVGMNVSA